MMVRQSNDWIVTRSTKAKTSNRAVSATKGLILVSMFSRTSVRPDARTSANTSASVGIRAPGTATCAGNSGSVFDPQSSVLSCRSVRSCTRLPTYGYSGSPGHAGAVSTQCEPLTVRSWITTSCPSAVTPVSSSSVDTARFAKAYSNAGKVFSGRTARAPRWPWMSKGAA
jgi:hypothetical protein